MAETNLKMRAARRPLLRALLRALVVNFLLLLLVLSSVVAVCWYLVATTPPKVPDPVAQESERVRQQTLVEEAVGDSIKNLGGQIRSVQGPWRIEAINLSGPEVTDESLAALGLERLEGLRSLTLYETAVTDKGLACVAKLPELRYLRLNRSRITDKGLTHLVWMKQLHTVQLVETPVTDAGLAILSVREQMWRLEVIHCEKVTDDGVARFRKARKCEVYYCDVTGRAG